MQITRFLDVALTSPAKVKVLRRLVLDSKPKSGRALARDVGMSHAQILHVLKELHAEGMVTLEWIGRSCAYALRREIAPVKDILVPLFQKERGLPDAIAQEIAHSVQTPALAIAIFGSVAKGTDRAESDLDMAFIVEGQRALSVLKEELAGEVADKAASLGVTLGSVVLTRAELQRRFRARDSFIRELVDTARRASGAYLTEVITRGRPQHQDSKG